MTERVPDRSFDDIAELLRTEMHDPHGEALKSIILKAQRELDELGEITESTADRIANDLNDELDELVGEEFYVTGRARIYSENADKRIEDGIDKGYEAFHPRHALTDSLGDTYYPLNRQRCRFDFVTVEPADGEFDPDSDDEATRFRIECQLSVLRDDQAHIPGANGLDISVFADDLETLEPVEPSLAKREAMLRQNYPAVAAQLESLPEELFDDKDSLAMLKKFRLKLDHGAYPYNRLDQRSEVLETASDILWDRLILDHAVYKIRFKGKIYGAAASVGYAIHKQKNPTDLYGTAIGAMMLNLSKDSNRAAINEYHPCLVLSAPAPDFYGGDHIYILPITSISQMTSIRNQPIFSDEMRQMNSLAGPSDRLEPVDGPREQSSQSDVGEFSNESLTIPINYEASPLPPEELLAQYLESYQQIWAEIRQKCDVRFKNSDEARALQREIQGILFAFCRQYRDILTAVDMEFSGECVEYVETMPGVMESAERGEAPSLNLSAVEVQQGDALTVRHGNGTGKLIVNLNEHYLPQGGMEYSVTPFMFFHDKTAGASFSLVPAGADFSVPIYNMSIQTQFAVRMTSEGGVDIPALARMVRCREAFGRIAIEQPDVTFLPVYLSDVKDAVDAENPDVFIDLDVKLLKAVSEAILDNDTAATLTTEALSAILGQREVDLAGATYKQGKLTPARRVKGKLMGVIDSAPSTGVIEPVLVIDGNDNETYYFPLAQITRVRL